MRRGVPATLGAGVLGAVAIVFTGCASSDRASITRDIGVEHASIAAVLESGLSLQDRVGALCRLASGGEWRDALRIYEISEAEYAALPERDRLARFESDKARAGQARALIERALEEIAGARAGGDLPRAERLAGCLRRFAEANRGPRALALATLYADLIDRRLAEIGA